MSYLNVTNVSHSFGGRQILENVSFKLMRGEHVGLVGANGEGKSTFLNIVTGHTLPDEGKVEWPGKVTVGYLDQQSTLQKGMTIREVLRTAFDGMYKMEAEMLELYEKMGDATPEEMDKMMETVGEIQTELEHGGFYSLDSKIEETANGLGLGSIGLDRDVAELSGGQRSKVLLTKLLLQNSSILLLDEPTNYLDVEHIEWLTKFLQNYENAFILISHDISFLNKVVNVISTWKTVNLPVTPATTTSSMKCTPFTRRRKKRLMNASSRKLPSWKTLLPATRRAWPLPTWQKAARKNWTKWK